MTDLTVFVPTRGRPKVIQDFFVEFERTKRSDTKIIFVVDEEDEHRPAYMAKRMDGMTFMVAPPNRRGMVGALNWAVLSAPDLGYSVGFMGDDHRPRTDGWDTKYLDALREMGSGFVYGDDLFQGERIPTHVAMTTDVVRTLGWMAHPGLDHLFVDTIWYDLGHHMGRIKYLPDVIVEHLHPLAGKARYDRNYRVVNNMIIAKHDKEVYEDYHATSFMSDVSKLRNLL